MHILQIFMITFLSAYVTSHDQKTNNAIYNDYYWRDYKWTIPDDAFPAGKDSNGQQTYIGQAYIHGDGIFVVQIFPQAREIFAHSYGLKKATSVMKILCSKDMGNFKWEQTNSKYFHVNMTSENPVIGGYDHRDANKGMLYVGRVIHHVVVRVGSVEGKLQDAKVRYVHGDSLQSGDDFEVLLYDSKDKNDPEVNK